MSMVPEDYTFYTDLLDLLLKVKSLCLELMMLFQES
jgi:hypothetical protein